MNVKRFLVASITFATLFVLADSLYAWNPGANWRDSYAVGDQCYCDSSNFDHELDTKSARTPLGEKNVVEICDDLNNALGDGPTSERIPYNDIQCGNGPANNANDETGGPGRVDQGNDGCDSIGPRWNLEKVYGPWPESCTASQRLQQNQWYMFSLPCDVQLPKKGSVREVLADDLGDNELGNTWIIYELLESGEYAELDLDSQLKIGTGYWLLTTDVDKVIDVVGEFAIEVDVALRADSTIGAWSLIGTPFQMPVEWRNVNVVDSGNGQVKNISAASQNAASCESNPIASSCEVSPKAYKWTEAGNYETLDLQSGSLDAFEAAWVLTGKNGMRMRVPKP